MHALLVIALISQGGGPERPEVDPARVDRAIERGASYLLAQELAPFHLIDKLEMRLDDLVLYALFHAGVDRGHPRFRALLKKILETPLERTYCVSVQAMLLSELDPEGFQTRLMQCAQFLVDNQAANGQWSYGRRVPQDEETPTFAPPDVATGGASRDRDRTGKPQRPKRTLVVRRRRPPPIESGDNSNSQYALLGLRACIEANVLPPAATVRRAADAFEFGQNRDGGWGYDRGSTGSMTVGAIASLILCRHYLGENWRTDRRIAAGLRWLAGNWTVKTNPGHQDSGAFLCYYLYGIERAGVLSGMERIGSHDWYREGAEFLLGAQREDGSWDGGGFGGNAKDACFAILFLRRSTVPLPKVATGAR